MDRRARRDLDASVRRLQAGDRAAFRTVFDLAHPALLAVSNRMLGDPHDAEDAAQTSLLKVFDRIAEFDPQRDALSWILGVGAYECRTVRTKRRRSREREPLPSAEPADGRPDPEARSIESDLLRAIESVIDELRPGDRETILAGAGLRDRPTVAGATFRKRWQRAVARARATWRSRHEVD